VPDAETPSRPDRPEPECPSAQPGSKEAVLKSFGIFQDDDDLDEQLARLRAIRKAAGKWSDQTRTP
jgi:hypothetical protein